MYKVFVNNRPLTFSQNALESKKNIAFASQSNFYEAIDLLQNQVESINFYSPEIEHVWELFKNEFKNIFASGGVVLNSKNEMLWIYRLGKWDLPKGKMEKGENKEETAAREVEEECGITGLRITKELATTYHMYFHKEYILKITYWFEMNYNGKEKLIPQTEEGISDVKWFAKNKLIIPLENTYPNILGLLAAYY